MTIIGTGIDATEIARIAEAIERYGDRFVHRIFTEGEIAYCRRKKDFASSFAGSARIAASNVSAARRSVTDSSTWLSSVAARIP